MVRIGFLTKYLVLQSQHHQAQFKKFLYLILISMKKGFLKNLNRSQKEQSKNLVVKSGNQSKQFRKDSFNHTMHQNTTIQISPNNLINDVQLERSIEQFKKQLYLTEILQFIYDVADRNQVYKCNFIHLHIPLALVLKILDVKSKTLQKEETYLRSVIKAISHKVTNHKTMKLQLKDISLYQNFKMIINDPKITQQRILTFLRYFLENNKEIMKALMPYYFTYFALVVNKQVVFLGKKEQLIEYPIDYRHKKVEQISRENIKRMLEEFQRMLVDKYHSKDI